MLDTTTKRRIDTARDILVGKVPDPKSQVEQITIALIYKFMDDMDLDSEELGGEPTFFSGEYEKYGWRKIFNPSLGGFEMLNLYSEAILKMGQNPNLPQLFRDIFKNAYLPYRDPETLKSFLKIINDFSYDHSERLGDAFEYLLSVLGSQGDAGQFRTPRHVIDFMTALIAPKKNETVLDPACGTAGFLISAYKHILKENSSNYDKTDPYTFEQNNVKLAEITVNGKHYKGDKLSPDDRARIIQNIKGYDISPDMVRLSLVNLYLHGFTDPHIHEYDTLTSEERWNEFFDIILANPPFMSPKGGIRPHKRFAVQSKRSEVLFVDYMAEHLTPTGKAAIIVPEGIIFQSGTAYKSLRKMLVEDNYLVGVISLPAGVFNPYSGVKTSILWLDKSLAKKTDKILFAKIENDGFDLGAQRRPIKQNDLPEVFRKLTEYRDKLMLGEDVDFENEVLVSLVEKEKIEENGEFNLSGERYKQQITTTSQFPYVELKEIVDFQGGSQPPKETFIYEPKNDYVRLIQIRDFGKNPIPTFIPESSKNKLCKKDDVFIARYGASLGRICRGQEGAYNVALLKTIPDEKKITKDFLFLILQSDFIQNKIIELGNRAAQAGVRPSDLGEVPIPLPPLSVQEEIVAEIESYQKIIDGARQVVENYKPKIDIDPEWEMVELGEHCKIKGGNAFKSSDYVDKGIQLIRMGNVKQMFFDKENSPSYLPQDYLNIYSDYVLVKGDLLISMTGTVGKEDYGNVCQIDVDQQFLLNQRVGKFEIQTEQLDGQYLYFIAQTDNFRKQLFSNSSGGVRQANISNKGIESISIPLPDIDTQHQIVAQIEKEQKLVNANKQLIEIFEQKIKDRIAKVWGE